MIKLAYIKDKNGFNAEDSDLAHVTHICYSFAKVVDKKGTVKEDFKYGDELKKFQQKHPQIKILLAVGGWGAGNFSEAVINFENRSNFIKSCYEILIKYKFDGIDLDWEYPTLGDGNISFSPLDKDNFTSLVKEFRTFFDQNDNELLITFACGALFKMQYCYDFKELYKYSDFMNLMTYDMGGSFSFTGHQTNLYYSQITKQYGADDIVRLFDELGYYKDKIVLGSPFYGRGSSNLTNYNSGHINEYINGDEGMYFTYDEVKELLDKDNTQVFHDNEASAVYLVHEDTFITYEDSVTLLNKLDYIKKNNLAGIMFYEHETDKTRELIHVIINYE